MKNTKFNERLKRVQVGRQEDIPIGKNSGLWYLWIYKDGSWDADSTGIPKEQELYNKISLVFCVWHGNYRTNLFLVDKEYLKKLQS